MRGLRRTGSVKTWRKVPPKIVIDAPGVQVPDTAGEGLFSKCFILAVTNPQPMIFCVSLMPQFISPEDDYVSRVTLLSVLFVGICFLVHLGYSAIAAVARKWLAGPNFSIWLNRVSGALFWLLGLSVIWNALFNR